MAELFNARNVKIMELNRDGVVDEVDYQTLLLLYEDSLKSAAAYHSALEDVINQELNSGPRHIEEFLESARKENGL